MADEDQSSKTEEPTSRKLAQGRERGQVASSQDVKIWLGLVAIVLSLSILLPAAGRDLVEALTPFLERPETMALGTDDAAAGLLAVLIDAGFAAGPVLLLLALAGIAGGLMQTGLIWAPSKLQPDLNKLSPLKGLQRLVSMSAVVEFVKGLVKLAVVAAVSGAVLLPLMAGMETWSAVALPGTLDRVDRILLRLTGAIAAAMTVIAAADLVYQRFSFLRQMRMTTQEVRDEHKQQEGDPKIKARIRRLRQERARKRMMAAVPTATVVITNPTHYAVALAYDMQAMAAPKVVAKGVDLVARRIREVAEAHDVPLVENPPLARALHAAVEIDDEIPAEHYQAVAQVIGWVMRGRAQGAGGGR